LQSSNLDDLSLSRHSQSIDDDDDGSYNFGARNCYEEKSIMN
jgi:hypothetical protein